MTDPKKPSAPPQEASDDLDDSDWIAVDGYKLTDEDRRGLATGATWLAVDFRMLGGQEPGRGQGR